MPTSSMTTKEKQCQTSCLFQLSCADERELMGKILRVIVQSPLTGAGTTDLLVKCYPTPYMQVQGRQHPPFRHILFTSHCIMSWQFPGR